MAHIKHLKKDDPGVPDLKIDEDIITDDKGKSEILNDHFTSVFTEEDLSTVPDRSVNPKPCLGALKITVKGVVKQLNSLNHHEAMQWPGWYTIMVPEGEWFDHSFDVDIHFSRISEIGRAHV